MFRIGQRCAHARVCVCVHTCIEDRAILILKEESKKEKPRWFDYLTMKKPCWGIEVIEVALKVSLNKINISRIVDERECKYEDKEEEEEERQR